MGMDVSGIGNPEAYFRASCWSWRPIHAIIDIINENYKLGIDTSNFGYNDGGGIKDPERCKKMSRLVKAHLSDMGLEEDGDKVYIALGAWVKYPSGQLISEAEAEAIKLDEMNHKVYLTPISTSIGLVVPAHSTSREHVLDFCKFLNVCKGFEIW